jgi:catechol 2,3-dioxygenase-like lactoylglutathione lyase family enzyme
VRDVAISEAFYTEILGFQVTTKGDFGTFLTCGKSTTTLL